MAYKYGITKRMRSAHIQSNLATYMFYVCKQWSSFWFIGRERRAQLHYFADAKLVLYRRACWTLNSSDYKVERKDDKMSNHLVKEYYLRVPLIWGSIGFTSFRLYTQVHSNIVHGRYCRTCFGIVGLFYWISRASIKWILHTTVKLHATITMSQTQGYGIYFMSFI